MATTTTFDSLQSDVRAYIERGSAVDVTVFDQIPRLINSAERRVATELKIQGFINVVSVTLVAGQSVYAKPDRWRDTVAINIATGAGFTTSKTLFGRDYGYLRSYWPNPATQDEPEFYADYDYTHWLIAPTPDAAYPAEIIYYELLPLLDDTNQTNWLTEYAPRLLLYGTLLEAAPFLKETSQIAIWQSFYDREAGMINGQDLAKIIDRSSVRKEA
jgi:hypothetical protein